MKDVNVSEPGKLGLNKPKSGTYGEGAALERLEEQLPAVPGGPSGGAGAPAPDPAAASGGLTDATPGGGGGPGPLPPGIPGALLSPSSTPAPVGGPRLGPPPAVSQQQKRLAILDQMVNNPALADATREWAQAARDTLIDRMGR